MGGLAAYAVWDVLHKGGLQRSLTPALVCLFDRKEPRSRPSDEHNAVPSQDDEGLATIRPINRAFQPVTSV